MERVLFNFFLAMEGVNANKLRSFLTALGIVFGVGAVIAMLAIGTGAKQAILEQMKLIGTNNIVIKGLELTDEGQNGSSSGTGASGSSDSGEKRTYSPGLTLKDAEAIQAILPAAERVSPEVVLATNVVRNGRLEKGRCVGITNAFFDLNNLGLATGRLFHDKHIEQGASVCIIGKEIQARFFSQEDPLGQQLKCGNTWLTIIGVLDRRKASQESLSSLGIRDYNSDVYIPVTTALLRFRNRALVNQNDLGDEDSDEDENRDPNHNQLDQLVVRIGESDKLKASADVIARILKRRHYDVVDFQVEVPELLLEQEQKTQDTFNLVLAAIAGISLLVGGIGIMNIMLASVLERVKEIGVRRSLGANQRDIIFQFLFEAVFISLMGGLIGMALGIGAARGIAAYAEIPTVVSGWSILLSFGVAAAVGLVFGIFPARKAAIQDPIKALRSD